jgi:predicted transcriptional regulator
MTSEQFPRVRAHDPYTSFAAVDAAKEVAPKHFNIIFQCLEKHGPLGKDGIAKLTDLDGNQVARRLNDMKVVGLIRLTGNTVRSNTGNKEREWTI